MIEFHIDGKTVEISPDSSVTISALLDDITDPARMSGKKFPLVAPMSPNNRSALEYIEQILSPALFNQTAHLGKIECQGTTLVQGEVELVRCENDPDGSGRYVLNLHVKPPEWVRNASRKKLRELAFPFEAVYGQDLIQKSWTSDSPVKFLPVKRDGYPDFGQQQVTLRALGFDNYHPFVQVYTLLNAIARESGYRIVSKFLNEPFFQSLYMSGNYPEGAENKDLPPPDFGARRNAANKTTTANADGKVFATSLQAANSVGNPVDTGETAAGSGKPGDMYFGKSFQMVNNRPTFTPDRDVIAGFEFQVQFSCAQSILSAQKISLPAIMIWDDETLFEPSTDNPLKDLKNTVKSKGTYTFLFFYFPSGTKYVNIKTASGGETNYAVSSQQQTIQIGLDFVQIVYQYYSGGKFIVSEEWVMYDSAEFNAIPAEKNYQITVRSQPRLRKKNVPVYFDTLRFEGGKNGSSFTFFQGAAIRPVFYGTPEAGTNIAFSSLFHHEEPQIRLVQALGHLFGMHFYTDEPTKTIYVEPRFEFLDPMNETDWTEKIDDSRPVVLEEWGEEYHEEEIFRYRAGDAAVDRQNNASGFNYGEWNVRVAARNAKNGRSIRTNPLFTATRDEKGSFVNAPDASMIVVGNRDDDDSQSFPAKIVRFLGMKNLPGEQKWGWPSYAQQYPLVMFHSEGEDWFTLCFDNRNGQLGLKNYIQPVYDRVNKGKKLTLFLKLTPSDMEAVLHPNSAGRNFRGNFKFDVRGETVRGRLVQITGYNPSEGGVARCVFSVEP